MTSRSMTTHCACSDPYVSVRLMRTSSRHMGQICTFKTETRKKARRSCHRAAYTVLYIRFIYVTVSTDAQPNVEPGIYVEGLQLRLEIG